MLQLYYFPSNASITPHIQLERQPHFFEQDVRRDGGVGREVVKLQHEYFLWSRADTRRGSANRCGSIAGV